MPTRSPTPTTPWDYIDVPDPTIALPPLEEEDEEQEAPTPATRIDRAPTPSSLELLCAIQGQAGGPLEKYAREEELGRGGMGRVLRARDNDLRRDVAMKVLGRELRDLRHVAMFLQEAQIAGSLEHPNVPPVHELGIDERGDPFFTMRLIAGGETLQQVITKLRAADPEAQERWTFDRRVAVIQQVCHALEHAHRRGIVHRDVKPSNVLVGPAGEVYLVDWGLARRLDQEEEPSELLGTPAYMSPEQARGEPVDARSDVYSLVAVLYELLGLVHYLDRSGRAERSEAGGRPPRRGRSKIASAWPELGEEDSRTRPPSAIKTLHLVWTRIPWEAESRVDPVHGRVPRALSLVCKRGLEKDPAARFQSAAELEQALQSWQEGNGPVVCPGTALQAGLSRSIRWIDRRPVLGPAVLWTAIMGSLAGNLWGLVS